MCVRGALHLILVLGTSQLNLSAVRCLSSALVCDPAQRALYNSSHALGSSLCLGSVDRHDLMDLLITQVSLYSWPHASHLGAVLLAAELACPSCQSTCALGAPHLILALGGPASRVSPIWCRHSCIYLCWLLWGVDEPGPSHEPRSTSACDHKRRFPLKLGQLQLELDLIREAHPCKIVCMPACT